jgi:two-component system phosphate regulon response regulator PhoB
MSEKLPPKVLVADVNEARCTSVCNTIERAFFDIEKETDPAKIVKTAGSVMPNAMIIGNISPDKDHLSIIKDLRAVSRLATIPIICIAEGDKDLNKIKQINDPLLDCVDAEFTPSTLMSAVKLLLRKSQPIFQEKVIRYKDVSMDLATYTVVRGSKRIHLGPTEFKILQLFIKSPNSIFSRRQIIDQVWGLGKDIEQRTVDVHVNRLRTMLKKDKRDLPMIKTVRSSGYCLNLPNEGF